MCMHVCAYEAVCIVATRLPLPLTVGVKNKRPAVVESSVITVIMSFISWRILHAFAMSCLCCQIDFIRRLIGDGDLHFLTVVGETKNLNNQISVMQKK